MDHRPVFYSSSTASSLDPVTYTSSESNPSMYSQFCTVPVPHQPPANPVAKETKPPQASNAKDMNALKSILQEAHYNMNEMNALLQHTSTQNGVCSPALKKELIGLVHAPQNPPTNSTSNTASPTNVQAVQISSQSVSNRSLSQQSLNGSDKLKYQEKSIESQKLQAEEKSPARKPRSSKKKVSKKKRDSSNTTDVSGRNSADYSRSQIEELRQEEADLPGLDDSGLSKEIDSLSVTIQQLVKENQQFQSCLANPSTNTPQSLQSYGLIPPSLSHGDCLSNDLNTQFILKEQERLDRVESQVESLVKNTEKVDEKLETEIKERDGETSKLEDQLHTMHQRNEKLTENVERLQKNLSEKDSSNVHESCQAHIEELMRQKLLLQKQLDLFLKVDSLDKNNGNDQKVTNEAYHGTLFCGRTSNDNGNNEKHIMKLQLENQTLNEKLDALVITLQNMSTAFQSTRDEFSKLRSQKAETCSHSTPDSDFLKKLQKQVHDLQLDVQIAYKELHKEKLEKDKVVNEKEKIQHILSSELCSANEEIQELKQRVRELQDENKLLKQNTYQESMPIVNGVSTEHVSSDKKKLLGSQEIIGEEQEKLIEKALQPLQKELGEERLKSKLIHAAHEETMQFVEVLQETVREAQEKNQKLECKYKKLRKFLGIKNESQGSTQDLRDFSEKIENITQTSNVIDENYKNMLSTLGTNIGISVDILSSHLFSSPTDIHPCPELAEDPSFWFAAQCSKLRWMQKQLRELCLQNLKRTTNQTPPPDYKPPLNECEVGVAEQQTKLTQLRDQQIDHLKNQFVSPQKTESNDSSMCESDSMGESYICDGYYQ